MGGVESHRHSGFHTKLYLTLPRRGPLPLLLGAGRLRTVLAFAFAFALASCGPLIGVGGQGDAPTRYALQPPSAETGEQEPLPVSVMVEEPAASDALDGRRIALRPSPLEIKYYAKARWTDRAPKMVQDLLATALADRIRDVGGETMPMAPDYRLHSQLEAFQAVYNGKGPPAIEVTLNVKLFSRSPAALVGGRRFSARINTREDRMTLIAEAFNEATQQVLTETARWVADTIAAPAEAAR